MRKFLSFVLPKSCQNEEMRWASRVVRMEETTSVSNSSYNTWDVSVIWKVCLKEMKKRIRFSWLRMHSYC